MNTVEKDIDGDPPGESSSEQPQAGFLANSKEIEKLIGIFRANTPRRDDKPETFLRKLAMQAEAFNRSVSMVASLNRRQGSLTEPVLVTRKLPPASGIPRYEVWSLARTDAVPGSPLFVEGDPALDKAVQLGDVAVLSAAERRIIDLDNGLRRYGEYGIVVALQQDSGLPYEIDLEGLGDGRKVSAMAWQRLQPPPAVGDRVKVMGGVIHAYAPKEATCRFKRNPWPDDLDESDLAGATPRWMLYVLLAGADRSLHPGKYPQRPNRYNGHRFILYGPPGVGKTFTVRVFFSIMQRKYNSDGKERVVFIVAEGSAIEGHLVGSGPAALREIRTLTKEAVSQGKLPLTYINEAGSLLRDRKRQNEMMDGGSSLSTHEQFLAILSGHDEVQGLVIVDLNTEKNMDEATRQRFTCVAYPRIDCATMVDQMFGRDFVKNREIFEGDWKEIRQALVASLDTTIGTVLVGSETVPVTVGHLTSGRMYDEVIRECLGLVDLSVYSAGERGMEAPFQKITGPLLYHSLIRRAWSLFKCWDDFQAREVLVPEIARPEKAGSLSRPTAFPWYEVPMMPDYDCRGLLDELTHVD